MAEIQLSFIEKSELQQCEAIIEQGLRTFVDVGAALLKIHDKKLYRQEYSTFEEYCNKKWGFTDRRARMYIDASKTVGNLQSGTTVPVLPTNERQTRPLTKLAPEDQVKAWAKVIETAPEGKITAKVVLEAAKEIQQERREERRAERIETIIQETAKPIHGIGKFPIIYADPPWRYDFSRSTSREIENQYPTMELNDICNLEVAKIANDDCVLFLWATNPKLQEALLVIDSWGFEYKTNMVWVKDKIGMGYYARSQHELLLIATRGNVPVPAAEFRPSSVMYSDRDQHSKKPDGVYEIIEKMYPEYAKVELFARNKRDGWEAWGNQL
jgi:N6-adenosine-specific RNA methylase IME4